MKSGIFFFSSLFITLVTVFFVHRWLGTFENPGYVLIGIGSWSMETSLIVFLVSLIVGFYVFYLFFRWLGWLLRLPWQVKNRSRNIKFNRSQEALIAGLVGSAEGNWEQAEKVLIKHASHSGAPLIHYLTAAKAAQSRGAYDKRDEYLKKAASHAPGSDVAIGLTQAELHFSANQFEQALETLTKLHSIDSTHASVLKLLHQTYQHLGDWQGLRKLLPSLNKNKILMETDIKKLEIEAFGGLLKQAIKQGSTDEMRLLWTEIPNHIKKNPDVAAVYFAAMINAGLGTEIENELVETLTINWDETLLLLFGSLQSNDVFKQLEVAESLLPHHKEDGVLLTILGKLSYKCQDYAKAEDYLSKSIAIDPNVQAYRLLGDLYAVQGEEYKANRSYKQGLELASSGVVSQVDAAVLGS
ncbi:heme biosynthesis HemY N-terminal domain-containing protein [Methyloglobulus sp.]|uniref:heme biosynthesis HemY N-terminal domain-containing protein n=1 Tax=Methyloglobulus sp. TaxID=2518622 RepID=UPI0039890280